MNYLMTPLEEHYDDGFGAMAMSFRLVAEKLKKIKEDDSFLQHLPLNFLLRHSIELYLKSGIIILHRRFRMPFGDKPSTSEPMVFDGTHWKPFHKVHSIGKLFGHWEGLVTPNAEKIQSVCEHKPDWTVPKPLYEWIDAIEKTDHTSTYYRYPKTSEEKTIRLSHLTKRSHLPSSLTPIAINRTSRPSPSRSRTTTVISLVLSRSIVRRRGWKPRPSKTRRKCLTTSKP